MLYSKSGSSKEQQLPLSSSRIQAKPLRHIETDTDDALTSTLTPTRARL